MKAIKLYFPVLHWFIVLLKVLNQAIEQCSPVVFSLPRGIKRHTSR